MDPAWSSAAVPTARNYAQRASYNQTPTASSEWPHRMSPSMTPSPQPTLRQSQQEQPQQPRASHLVHRFQHSPSTRRAHSPMSVDTAGRRNSAKPLDDTKDGESSPQLAATSSYLQEKLLRERKVESERCSSRLSNDVMSSSQESRAGQSSPTRGPHDIHRPRSSAGSRDGSQKGGLGLKEMEQTLATLHKQNFDLKLELFHRREKQSALEERCGSLEVEKRELEDINDKLVHELEMRDKAVEEAVAMIITLESRLDQLLRERELTQKLTKGHLLASDANLRHILSSALGDGAREASAQDDSSEQKYALSNAAQAALHRMPSFVSEQSESTQNLRSVFLNRAAGASLVSLPRASEDGLDGDMMAVGNRIASPSLSILSESSFLSIYGKRNDLAMATTPRPKASTSAHSTAHASANKSAKAPNDTARMTAKLSHSDTDTGAGSPASVVAHALASTAPPSLSTLSAAGSKSSTPARKRSTSATRGQGSSAHSAHGMALTSLTELIGTNSPLQRLEKMEMSLQEMDNASRPVSKDDELPELDVLTRHLRSHDLGKTQKQDMKDGLRRVRTDAPFAKDGSNAHNLPPTPDTISTSTLRRFKNSNDTLSQEKEMPNDRSYLALSESATSQSTNVGKSAVKADTESLAPSGQAPSTTAFNSRRHELNGLGGYFGTPIQVPPRPRSAGETTVSYRGNGSVWGDSDSSDDDMNIDGNDSASLHDYWLRESLRPTGHSVAPIKSKTRRTGRISPDLFRFPASSSGWATTAMFGSLGGNGYLGSMHAASPPLVQKTDALGDSLNAPYGDGLFKPGSLPNSQLLYGLGGIPAGPPPPPHRRSSLHAHTGSAHGILYSNSGSRSGSRHGTANSISSAQPAPPTPRGKIHKSPTRSEQQPKAAASGGAGGSSGSATLPRETRPRSQPGAPQEPLSTPKQRHYPPVTGSNSAAPRSRVMSLFRRSGSHEPSSLPASPMSAPPTEPAFGSASKSATLPVMGIPSRSGQGGVDDDGSATPPPILRNPRGTGETNQEHVAAWMDGSTNAGDSVQTSSSHHSRWQSEQLPTTPKMPDAAQHASQTEQVTAQQQSLEDSPSGVAAGGGNSVSRKKWLGLGRVANLRNRGNQTS